MENGVEKTRHDRLTADLNGSESGAYCLSQDPSRKRNSVVDERICNGLFEDIFDREYMVRHFNFVSPHARLLFIAWVAAASKSSSDPAGNSEDEVGRRACPRRLIATTDFEDPPSPGFDALPSVV